MFGADMPIWVMLLMGLAVIGLIVLLIYLRKKGKDS
jgi:LPXTG-motif cell wall-anchored protein